jgi:hypothetical protein
MPSIQQFNGSVGPRYGHPPKDGAMYRCVDCGELMWPKDCYITVTPNPANHAILCKVCIDDDWCALATYWGQLT